MSTNALSDPSAHALDLRPETFERFCRFITTRLGIKMSAAKLPMLQSRLQRRLRELRLPSLEDYQTHLFDSAAGEAEQVHFIDAVTTNKTDFFREPRHFDVLTRTVLPRLDPARGPGAAGTERSWRLNLWCAGCSSGEEPYTLAMVLAEFGATRGDFDFSILATDISTRVLATAGRAIYPADRIGPVPAALRSRHLLRSRDPDRAVVRIAPELRAHLAFQRLNFMDASYDVPGAFDVVFFRNVMIYFDPPTQEAVIGRLCRHLRPGGYLFVGHSESLAGLDVPVRCVDTAVYRKPP